ncbi:hypothetical protein AGMMS50229_20340 [Campylobacterota bacterium]|nr:hypothetical protein AGMMS50229_20340 [Campylobacterota bacterium]
METASRRVLIPINNPLGGVKTYTLSYIRYLCDEGFRFTVLAPAGEAFDRFQDEAKNFPDMEFIAISGGSRFLKMIKGIRKALKTGRFALTHSQGLQAGFQTAVARWGLHVPAVITLHGVLVPQDDVPGRAKRFKKRLIGFFTKYTEEIIPVSEDCAVNHLENFPEWKKGPCHITPILNGIDLNKFSDVHQPEISLRKQFGFSEKKILLGFFGRFMPEKGFLPLLDALEILASRGYADRICLIVTKDNEGYAHYFAEMRRNDTLKQMVYPVEPQNNIAPLIAQMNLVLMPSLWEACSLVSMESMVMGVPFIGSDCIGVREVLRDTPCRMSLPNIPSSIAAEIEYYINHSWDEKAKDFAPEAKLRFDVRNGCKKMAEIYRKLLQ